MLFNPIIYGESSQGTLLYIYVSRLPNKTSYYTTEWFEPDGMIVTGVHRDGTETSIPNSQLSFSPNPITVESSLLRITHTEYGRIYGTTLALDIKLGIFVDEEIADRNIADLIIDPIIDVEDVSVQVPTPITLFDTVTDKAVDDLYVDSITDMLGSGSVQPIDVRVRRNVIDISDFTGDYTVVENDKLMLRTEYVYESEPQTVDLGRLCAVDILTSDKDSVESLVIT